MEVTPYLSFVAEVKGVPRGRRTAEIAGVIDQCDLGDVARQRIGSLSKGYRQRVGLAQALLNRPQVLILDEPTIGLDPRQIQEIRRLIKSLGGERTVILSTHILPEVSMTCNRVIIINHGQVVAMDTPANLTAQLQKATRIELLAAAPPGELERGLATVPGVTRVEPIDAGMAGLAAVAATGAIAAAGTRVSIECAAGTDPRAAVARRVVESGWELLELRQVVMSLEDIFVKLVTEESEVAA
jgi:ABC-2 type transport system ATP-binding protein